MVVEVFSESRIHTTDCKLLWGEMRVEPEASCWVALGSQGFLLSFHSRVVSSLSHLCAFGLFTTTEELRTCDSLPQSRVLPS